MKFSCLPCVALLSVACAFLLCTSLEARHHHHHHGHRSSFAINLNTVAYAEPVYAAPAYYYPPTYVAYPQPVYYAPPAPAPIFGGLSFGFSFR